MSRLGLEFHEILENENISWNSQMIIKTTQRANSKKKKTILHENKNRVNFDDSTLCKSF